MGVRGTDRLYSWILLLSVLHICRFPTEELTLEQHESIENNPHISGPSQFKPMFFKVHLYFSTWFTGPLSPSHWLKKFQGGVGSHLFHSSLPFSLETWPCHSLLGYSDNVDNGWPTAWCVLGNTKSLTYFLWQFCTFLIFLWEEASYFQPAEKSVSLPQELHEITGQRRRCQQQFICIVPTILPLVSL